ncbi:MAG: hypothetical protein KIT83_01080 [Bryobacterales bacterium]|nr:hypothetical protein [Bryobacterales bacterium]
MRRLATTMQYNRRLARAASSGKVTWKLLLLILVLLILAGAAGIGEGVFGAPAYLAGAVAGVNPLM